MFEQKTGKLILIPLPRTQPGYVDTVKRMALAKWKCSPLEIESVAYQFDVDPADVAADVRAAGGR